MNGNRKYISSSRISYYWKDKSITESGEILTFPFKTKEKTIDVVIDLGEPECMCCGKWIAAEKNPKYYDVLNSDNPEKVWDFKEVTSVTDRVHIIAHSLGGKEEPENMLVMCKECHRESPDTKYPRQFLKYIFNKRMQPIPKSDKGKLLYEFAEIANEVTKQLQNETGFSELMCRCIALENLPEPGVDYTTHGGVFMKESRIAAWVGKTLEYIKTEMKGKIEGIK